jgi:hypothetical protein
VERTGESTALLRAMVDRPTMGEARDLLNGYVEAAEKVDVSGPDIFGVAPLSKREVLGRLMGVKIEGPSLAVKPEVKPAVAAAPGKAPAEGPGAAVPPKVEPKVAAKAPAPRAVPAALGDKPAAADAKVVEKAPEKAPEKLVERAKRDGAWWLIKGYERVRAGVKTATVGLSEAAKRLAGQWQTHAHFQGNKDQIAPWTAQVLMGVDQATKDGWEMRSRGAAGGVCM